MMLIQRMYKLFAALVLEFQKTYLKAINHKNSNFIF